MDSFEQHKMARLRNDVLRHVTAENSRDSEGLATIRQIGAVIGIAIFSVVLQFGHG